nr:MAG TPA: tail fiber protein [Caudoviricetes sp.]
MTIQNQNAKNVYSGNGSTTVFPYTFAMNNDHPEYIHVYITGEDGVARETTDFTVDVNAGNVVYPKPGSTAPALTTGQKITLLREVPLQQLLALFNQGPFFSENIEQQLDEMEMQIQQLREAGERSLKTSVESTNFNAAIPLKPGKSFRINQEGTGFEVTEDPAVAMQAAQISATLATSAKQAAEEAQAAAEQSAAIAVTAAIKNYDNVAAMKADHFIWAGVKAITSGYYSANDGGGGNYIVRAKTAEDVEDNGSIHFLQHNLVAELINTQLNVKQWGAKGDNNVDDFVPIQKTIDFAASKKGGTVLIPKGTYRITSTLNVPPRVNILGNSVDDTIINKTDKEKEYDAIFEIVNGSGSAHYGVFEKMSLKSLAKSYAAIIAKDNPAPFLKCELLNINNFTYGIKLTRGTWLCKMNRLNIGDIDYGISLLNHSTSCDFANIYVMSAKVKAYEFEAVGYSHMSTLCADWCKGIVYDISYGNIIFDGCAEESTNATVAVNINNNAHVIFNNGLFFSPVGADSKSIFAKDGFIEMNHCIFGNANTTSAGKLLEINLNGTVVLNNCKYQTDFAQTDTITGNLKVSNAYMNKSYRSGEAFLGERSQGGSLKNIERYKTGDGKAIILDTETIPLMDSTGKSKEWLPNYKEGDVLLNNHPQKNGIFAYVAINSPNIKKTLLGKIASISSQNRITMTSLDYNTTAKDGVRIQKGDTLLFAGGYTGSVISVNYTTKEVVFYNATGSAVVGESGETVPSSFALKNSFVPVQIVHSGLTLDCPATGVANGQLYFDIETGKLKVYANGVWRNLVFETI